MFVRYASAITTGTVMTLGLLYIMQSLITIQPGVIVEPGSPYTVDWRRIEKPDEPPRVIEDPIDRKKLVQTLLPPRNRIEFTSTAGVGVPIPSQKVPPPITPVAGHYSDGPLVLLIKVVANYPIRAITNGIEGHVIVEFDVGADGRVTNVRIIESSHPIFEKASIEAAKRFKFKPRVVDGTPVATASVRNLFRFEMED